MENTHAPTMSLQQQVDINYKNEVCEVYELAAKHRLDACFLELKQDGPIHNASFTLRLTVGSLSAEAQGPTKIMAKTLAAQEILPELRRLPLPGKTLSGNSAQKAKLWKKLPSFEPTSNPIVCLHDLVTKWRGKPAAYKVVNVDKAFDTWVFYVRLTVAEETVVGAGLSKKEAKQNAAAKILNAWGYNFLCVEPENTKEELLLMTEVNSIPVHDAPVLEEPEVVQYPVAPQGNTSSADQSDSSHPEEEVYMEDSLIVDMVSQDDAEVTVADTQTPEVTTSQLEANDEPSEVELDAQLALELQKLLADVQPLLDFMGVETNPNTEEFQDVCSLVQPQTLDGKTEASPPVPDATDVDTLPEDNDQGKRSAEKRSVLTVVISMASVDPAERVGEDDCSFLTNAPQSAEPVGEDSFLAPGGSDESTPSTERPDCSLITNAPQSAETIGEDSFLAPGGSDESTPPTERPDCSLITNAPQSAEPIGEDSFLAPGESDPGNVTFSRKRPVSYILSHALVKKVLKLAGSHNRRGCEHMAINLSEKIKEQLIVGGECDISLTDLKKIGKAAAKQLVLEHGSARALLKAAELAAFKEDSVKHLNIELKAFLNRPKPLSTRFFTRLRRAFCFC